VKTHPVNLTHAAVGCLLAGLIIMIKIAGLGYTMQLVGDLAKLPSGIGGTFSKTAAEKAGPAKAAKHDNIAHVQVGDPDIEAARATARATLDDFLARAAAPQAGEHGFMVKAALKTSTGSAEHIWIGAVSRNGDRFTGRLANDPVDLAGARKGSQVSFNRADIDDWMYLRNGKIVGNETARVIISRLPEPQRTAMSTKFAD
jgi:uncharacterized protein YegJ (DUF2314 family)